MYKTKMNHSERNLVVMANLVPGEKIDAHKSLIMDLVVDHPCLVTSFVNHLNEDELSKLANINIKVLEHIPENRLSTALFEKQTELPKPIKRLSNVTNQGNVEVLSHVAYHLVSLNPHQYYYLPLDVQRQNEGRLAKLALEGSGVNFDYLSREALGLFGDELVSLALKYFEHETYPYKVPSFEPKTNVFDQILRRSLKLPQQPY